MIARPEPKGSGVARFRVKLLVAMMFVGSVITAIALYLGQHNVAAAVEQELQHEFQSELAALHNVQELRHAALVERCRALVRKPRIHAAFEDNALDLLYPSAQDELRDIMAAENDPSAEQATYALHAEFYRFLARDGSVIAPANAKEIGVLRPNEEAQLALPAAPERQQIGYLVRHTEAGAETVSEIIAMPIVSSETGEVIAAIVLGFKPAAFVGARTSGIERGLWLNQRLHFDALSPAGQTALAGEVTRAIAGANGAENSFRRMIDDAPHLLFYKRLNPGSSFPPAYEVCIYPLAEMLARQRQLRWQVLAAGAVLLLGAFTASNFIAGKLSQPVEKLAVDSETNLAQRELVEAALEATSEELQRAARFSADASHQLKTPVTVLRAGLEELLAREPLTPEECHDISALIHQTYRLSSVIEDLLLLSRMDAGRLKIEFGAINLTQLIEAALDDLGAQPNPLGLAVETDFIPGLRVAGEKRYLAIILQNLLENARKYNRPGGRIRIAAREQAELLCLVVGNTGRPIPSAAQARIFERFHRGEIGENVPGYGLGLNLARELARLHQGDLRLLRSDDEWTEFEVCFRIARVPFGGAGPSL